MKAFIISFEKKMNSTILLWNYAISQTTRNMCIKKKIDYLSLPCVKTNSLYKGIKSNEIRGKKR